MLRPAECGECNASLNKILESKKGGAGLIVIPGNNHHGCSDFKAFDFFQSH